MSFGRNNWRRPPSDKFRQQYDNSGSSSAISKAEKIIWEDGCAFKEIEEVTPKTVKLFEERGFTKLMPIQCNTFSAIYGGSNVIARDLTGSGKTLGFCLPLVESFRAKNMFDVRRGDRRKLRAIILAPTRELAV